METNQTAEQYGCLVLGQSPWARAWTATYKLYARSEALLQPRMRLMAL